ncbi:MAG: sodium:proton antiporter NhaD [Magnetococcales bacterium]|nr:sodium:proton antiporter NhaD [Magnetococcales bacterium]MBF0157135.1 sodium:proton antiporter NhaD [Magnetococcales bacterium]
MIAENPSPGKFIHPRTTARGTSAFATLASVVALFPGSAWASTVSKGPPLDLTTSPVGFICLGIFVLSYAMVMAEEYTHLKKSKPVVVAAGVIWLLVAWAYAAAGHPDNAGEAIRHNILEFAELCLFLLVAMTYINAMEERNVFEALRSRLIKAGFGYRSLFWITGLLAFFISPVADNLTTALLMGAVVMAVGRSSPQFVVLACINLVIAANAGGAFSPFGDITTLMVWQKGLVPFGDFFHLFIPSLVNWGVPAFLMSLAVPKVSPEEGGPLVPIKRGGVRIILLFLATIVTAVLFFNFLRLPPVAGMMLGFGYLQLFGFYLRRTFGQIEGKADKRRARYEIEAGDLPFDLFRQVGRVEWDTLLFFYGVILCVGGLGFIGYLATVSHVIYTGLGATTANVLIGLLSAVVDNIPIMFAVLTMQPDMDLGQWLLVTLTAGVGGSLLSVGSAAGVGLMGQARGVYTFFSHLKWTPAIALGYAASIWIHFLLNSDLFTGTGVVPH